MKKLTNRICTLTKPDPKKYVLLGDGDGLYLRISPNGTRVWIIDFLFQGQRKKVTLGVYGQNDCTSNDVDGLLEHQFLSIQQARLIASDWKMKRIAGINPLVEYQSKQSAINLASLRSSKTITLQECIDRFYSQLISGKKSAAGVKYRLQRIAEYLGDREICTISRKEFIDVIESIATGKRDKKPSKQMAGEILTTAKRLWRYAETRDWVEASCIDRLKRSDFDANPKKRDVTLEIDEIGKLWNVLSNPHICKADVISVAALKILILTGQRATEVCNATWSEIDFDAAIWRIPAIRTKSSRPHIVHLSANAISILINLHKWTGHQEFIFESPKRKKRPVLARSVNGSLQSLFKKGVLDNITWCHVHDFRRTLITRLPELGFDPFIGNKIANHKLPGVLGHYNHAEHLAERKRALEVWGTKIQAITIAQ